MRKLLNEIDELMASLEDTEHGQRGNEITKLRGKIQLAIMNYAEIEAPAQVTRVEVIDDEGRQYVNWNKDNKVELQYQDDGRTLKIFITRK